MRFFNKGRVLLLLTVGLGLALIALVACGSDAATPDNTGAAGDRQETASDAASLLRSELGVAAYERLLQGSSGTPASANTGIWVTGQGEVSAAPDVAFLNLGVEAFATTVAEARSNAATALGEVLTTLKAQGIADRDIQTRFFNISPRYTSREVTRCLDSKEMTPQELEPEAGSTSTEVPAVEVQVAPIAEPS